MTLNLTDHAPLKKQESSCSKKKKNGVEDKDSIVVAPKPLDMWLNKGENVKRLFQWSSIETP